MSAESKQMIQKFSFTIKNKEFNSVTTKMPSDNKTVLQYVPFSSFVHPSFWHTLTEMKLEVDKLNDSQRQIFGKFTNRDDIGTVFEVDGASFNRSSPSDCLYLNVTGTIMNKNTIEDFKSVDKTELLNTLGCSLTSHIQNKSWINNPSLLLDFLILSYADLKKYCYYYWFAFPVPNEPTVYLKKRASSSETFSEKQIIELTLKYKSLDNINKSFFTIFLEDETVQVKPLSAILDPEVSVQTEFPHELNQVIFCFSDPSNGQNPGWPLRIFLAALLEHCPFLAGSDIQVLAFRSKANGKHNGSQYYHVSIPKDIKSIEKVGWVGWERNDKGNLGPKLANMSASMDPIKLAETSSDLNIKLMKWRLVPDINLDIMKTSKCLLLGAGTLGCHVARNLVAWGFRHITFVDYGKVSYSNPSRQVLFNHIDCHSGGKKKAEAAAENLKLILPSADAKSLVAHIPMPGHPVGESLVNETMANVETITKAIEDHDIVFLLLDTREARWMPTLIASHLGKIVINAALGFDSYLVMRHGIATPETNSENINSQYIPGKQLGCYFCNDVTAPGNSMKDRTLDQQCTVTRPGVAAIAGALAVEMLVSVLQHPLRVDAPAAYNITNEGDNQSHCSVLGPIPHSIRGFLWSYNNVLPTCAKFKQCIACSDTVINKYREEGNKFLMDVFNDAKHLEEVTGLTELHKTAEMVDVLTLDDDFEDE